ncbi:MAG: hypothetical protein WC444_07325 [Candidatus Paceibacterota bacterium]
MPTDVPNANVQILIDNLANLIYGENASEDYDTMVMTGSTLLNRLESGKFQEFGATPEEAMNKGYYAVKNNTPLYQQAAMRKFPDKQSENKFKQSLAIANGLVNETIPRHQAMFFLKPKELKKSGMDFKKLKDTGTVGKYRTFSY